MGRGGRKVQFCLDSIFVWIQPTLRQVRVQLLLGREKVCAGEEQGFFLPVDLSNKKRISYLLHGVMVKLWSFLHIPWL